VEAHPVSFEHGLLVIGFDTEFEDYLGLVDNQRNHALLQTKLAELGHPDSQVKFIKQASGVVRAKPPQPAAPAAPAPAAATVASPKPGASAATQPAEKSAPVAFNKNDFKDDPLIKKALEIFKGQIIEVRA
jgi:hypothetical protein